MPTEEEKNEESKETVTKESNDTQSTNESNDSKEPSPIEEKQLSNDVAIDTKIEFDQFQKLVNEMREISNYYKETIGNLKDELSTTKKEFANFKDKIESKEPIVVTAIVKGKYDFTKKVAAMGHKSIKDFETHCRAVYDRINGEFPTINKLR